MEELVKKALNDIRPSLQNDGGDIDFVKLEGDIVSVKLKGSCAGCPMSQMTLKQGVERYLRETVSPTLVVVSVN